jgi:hypothetical protein
MTSPPFTSGAVIKLLHIKSDDFRDAKRIVVEVADLIIVVAPEKGPPTTRHYRREFLKHRGNNHLAWESQAA